MEVRAEKYLCGQDILLIPMQHFNKEVNFLHLFLVINYYFPNFYSSDPLLIPVRKLREVHALNKKNGKIMIKNTDDFFEEVL